MSKQTKEVWVAFAGSVQCGDMQIASCGHDGTPEGMKKADARARHIVACVNACADLPEGALDGGWTASGIRKYASSLEQQRNKLLKAAKKVVEENGHLADGDVCTLKPLVDAIAEVEAAI